MSLLLALVDAPPTIVETIIAMDFPMLYRAEPVISQELISKVSGATVTRVSQDFPLILIKAGKAKDMRSRWA